MLRQICHSMTVMIKNKIKMADVTKSRKRSLCFRSGLAGHGATDMTAALAGAAGNMTGIGWCGAKGMYAAG
jgi:hypothetical protein